MSGHSKGDAVLNAVYEGMEARMRIVELEGVIATISAKDELADKYVKAHGLLKRAVDHGGKMVHCIPDSQLSEPQRLLKETVEDAKTFLR